MDSYEGTQGLFINASCNYCRTSSTRSITQSQCTVILLPPSFPEIQKLRLFLASVCEWVNVERDEFVKDEIVLTPEEKMAFEDITSQHQLHSSLVPITQKRQSHFSQFFGKKVAEQKPQCFGKRRRESGLLFDVYSSTVPRVFIHIASRLKQLNACEARGVFRENGDTGERDRYLSLLNDVSDVRIGSHIGSL